MATWKFAGGFSVFWGLFLLVVYEDYAALVMLDLSSNKLQYLSVGNLPVLDSLCLGNLGVIAKQLDFDMSKLMLRQWKRVRRLKP